MVQTILQVSSPTGGSTGAREMPVHFVVAGSRAPG